jgi:hypothetical protein
LALGKALWEHRMGSPTKTPCAQRAGQEAVSLSLACFAEKHGLHHSGAMIPNLLGSMELWILPRLLPTISPQDHGLHEVDSERIRIRKAKQSHLIW